jgi:hypothetical protein
MVNKGKRRRTHDDEESVLFDGDCSRSEGCKASVRLATEQGEVKGIKARVGRAREGEKKGTKERESTQTSQGLGGTQTSRYRCALSAKAPKSYRWEREEVEQRRNLQTR